MVGPAAPMSRNPSQQVPSEGFQAKQRLKRAYLLGVGNALIKKGAFPVGGRPLHFGRLTIATSAKCGWLGRIIFGSRDCVRAAPGYS
ncbi:hypothetical protein HNY73_006727 [Argiope bruennichi]|uniref:Uncharacterized protein n=1 Tax=Argiope bruennichi TaxID=94029 RepID=A0A8T0FER0_ARGBR|nr:hypothetical protein HNY73_006727 [Argiope bruennichi]